VYTVVWVTSLGQTCGECVDRLMTGYPDGEVVEAGRGGSLCRVVAKREVGSAIGMPHGDAHPHSVVDEVDHGLVSETIFVPGLGLVEIADRQLEVVDSLKARCGVCVLLQ
jgi:hypothetical protein